MYVPYQLAMTTRVYFGCKCTQGALCNEKATIGSKTLIVTTGGSLKRLGFLDEITKWIEQKVFIYDGVTANPDVAEIREAIKLGKKEGVASVIGFGGGSAIDAAKAAAVGIVSDIDIEDFLLMGLKPPDNTLPIIAVPTTSGTGAELSKGAILSSRKHKVKSGIRGEMLSPAVAIVDPSYTFSLPMNVTMEAGFDVFAHAIESYCAVKANPFSEMMSERSIRLVGEALPRLSKNLMDEEAREMMCFASHIMGYNIKNVGNCLPHRMQYPIGALTETSHGAGLIALYPSWIRYESTINRYKIENALDWLGCMKGLPPDKRLQEWLQRLGIERTITSLGNTLIAETLAGMVTGNLGNDGLSDIPGIITAIYQESM